MSVTTETGESACRANSSSMAAKSGFSSSKTSAAVAMEIVLTLD